MDFSWLEVLPLPKSRPGWVVVMLLSLLGGLLYLLIQPRLLEIALNETDSKAPIPGNVINGVSQIIFPKTINRNGIIPITIKVISYDDLNLQIQSVTVTWSCYLYAGGLLVDNRRVLDSHTLPMASNQAPLSLRTPSCITDETTKIQGAFSIMLAKPNEKFNAWNEVSIEINGWKSTRSSFLIFFATMKYGLGIIVLLALISAGIADNKQYQDVSLHSRVEGDVTRWIFLRALSTFSVILAAFTALLVPDNYVSAVIVFILLVTLLAGWLLWPRVQSYWNVIRNRPRDNNHSEPGKEDMKTAMEGLSPAVPFKTKSSEKKSKSTLASVPLKAKAPKRKNKKVPTKPSKLPRSKQKG